MQVGSGTAARVPAVGDDLSAGDVLAGGHVDGREVRITGAVPAGMIDDDGLPKAGVDGIGAGEADGSFTGRPNVLVVHRIVPAVVAVVGDVVPAARRLRVPEVEGGVDAVTLVADRSVELADLSINGVIGIAMVEDRRDVVP